MGAKFYLEFIRDKGFIKMLSFNDSAIITFSSNSLTVNNFIPGLEKKLSGDIIYGDQKWEGIFLIQGSTYPL